MRHSSLLRFSLPSRSWYISKQDKPALQSALSSNGDAENKTSANVKGCVGTLTSLQTAMKSLAGFSFGGEFFLITGLLKDAPHLAAADKTRCIHIIVTGMFVSILFGSDENAQWLEQGRGQERADHL